MVITQDMVELSLYYRYFHWNQFLPILVHSRINKYNCLLDCINTLNKAKAPKRAICSNFVKRCTTNVMLFYVYSYAYNVYYVK